MNVLLIGGGTGGHILPLRPLIDQLRRHNATVQLVSADQDLDRMICEQYFADVPTHFLKCGKIRRYLSLKNIPDAFRIVRSIFRAKKLIKDLAPDVIFFKGGFVGFPFLMAVKLFRIKVKLYGHESDIVPGMLTRMLKKIGVKVFSNFEGAPLFFQTPLSLRVPTSRDAAISGTKSKLPHLLIMGSSQGALFLNKLFEQAAGKLLNKFHATLISGPGKMIELENNNFEQHAFLSPESLDEKIREADIIVSRASSMVLQIFAHQKPSILIPLPSAAQNHQVKNAQYFSEQNLCTILEQKDATPELFIHLIEETMNDEAMKKALAECEIEDGAEKIVEEILRN